MKEYRFKVSFGEGRYANGEYAVLAKDEMQATDIALQEICTKLNSVFPELDIEVSVDFIGINISTFIEDCFTTCRNEDDCYSFPVDDTHSLFILVQKDPDYNDGTLEYFIELNDTSSGSDEPCATYNTSCQIDNLEMFKETVEKYLTNCLN